MDLTTSLLLAEHLYFFIHRTKSIANIRIQSTVDGEKMSVCLFLRAELPSWSLQRLVPERCVLPGLHRWKIPAEKAVFGQFDESYTGMLALCNNAFMQMSTFARQTFAQMYIQYLYIFCVVTTPPPPTLPFPSIKMYPHPCCVSPVC